MFELKKIFSSFLMPLPALLIIGCLGLLILWFTRKKILASILLTASILGIFVLSFQPVSTQLLLPLERQYTAFLPPEKPLDFVMVLGNGHVVDDQIPPTAELSRAALMRLTEGIRIYRMYPGAKLILSGYAGGSEVSHARMLAKVALSLGVHKTDIMLLEQARDTWEEARQAAVYVGTGKMALVTSASHMPRAMNEFKAAGLNPTPAPTNYLAHNNTGQAWDTYMPKALNLEQSERYWYEQLGLWWQKLRDNVIDKEQQAHNTPKLEPKEILQNVSDKVTDIAK